MKANQKNDRRRKALAAQRSSQINCLPAGSFESLAKAYEHSQREALVLLRKGFHLGGAVMVDRDKLHER